MTKLTAGKYAGETVAAIQEKDPKYLQQMWNANIFSSNLQESELRAIRDKQQNNQLKRDCM